MRVLHKDLRAGQVRLRAETLDDLWYLSGLVAVGDRATALTHRRDETLGTPADGGRAKAAPRKPMVLTIAIEQVEFHAFSDRLRLTGVIVEGPQALGEHHTLNLECGSDVTITRAWSGLDLQRLDEAVALSKTPLVTIVALDDDEAQVSVVLRQGIRHVASVRSPSRGKRFPTDAQAAQKTYHGEMLRALRPLGGDHLLVVGPGFERDAFVAFLSSQQGLPPVLSVHTSAGGRAGVAEALRSGMDAVLAATRASEELQLVEKLLEGMHTDGPVAYGQPQVLAALQAGAVEVLLLTDVWLRDASPGQAQLRTTVQELARGCNATVKVVSTGHTGGEQLHALGGMAALLRYRLP